jgi:alanine-glyoxylate transaminase/serine-glyoxylate transaminase/serine-pyruvate transaminase
MMPKDYDADVFRKLILDKFDMSLGTGLGKVAGKVFRIGHLGHFNDLMLMGALSGVEMGLRLSGMQNAKGGVDAAIEYLAEQAA